MPTPAAGAAGRLRPSVVAAAALAVGAAPGARAQAPARTAAVAFSANAPETARHFRITVVNTDGAGTALDPAPASPYDDVDPAWSPDVARPARPAPAAGAAHDAARASALLDRVRAAGERADTDVRGAQARPAHVRHPPARGRQPLGRGPRALPRRSLQKVRVPLRRHRPVRVTVTATARTADGRFSPAAVRAVTLRA